MYALLSATSMVVAHKTIALLAALWFTHARTRALDFNAGLQRVQHHTWRKYAKYCWLCTEARPAQIFAQLDHSDQASLTTLLATKANATFCTSSTASNLINCGTISLGQDWSLFVDEKCRGVRKRRRKVTVSEIVDENCRPVKS